MGNGTHPSICFVPFWTEQCPTVQSDDPALATCNEFCGTYEGTLRFSDDDEARVLLHKGRLSVDGYEAEHVRSIRKGEKFQLTASTTTWIGSVMHDGNLVGSVVRSGREVGKFMLSLSRKAAAVADAALNDTSQRDAAPVQAIDDHWVAAGSPPPPQSLTPTATVTSSSGASAVENSVGEEETASSSSTGALLEGREHLQWYEVFNTTVHFRASAKQRRPSAPPVLSGAWDLGVSACEEVCQRQSQNCRAAGGNCKPCRFFLRTAFKGRTKGRCKSVAGGSYDGPFCSKGSQCTFCHHPFPDDDYRVNQSVTNRPNQRARQRRWLHEIRSAAVGLEL
mmetsp:Transcript_14195/g.49894  ORF Transcript_14195/g.49894 Transcript_14195/m.49894 type:complete len:337 (+) Transcript_14195:115-1125(+)